MMDNRDVGATNFSDMHEKAGSVQHFGKEGASNANKTGKATKPGKVDKISKD
jgi:hypothetical protein